MSSRFASLAVSAVLVAANLAGAEKRVTMESLPPAVQKTIQEQSQGATVRGFSKEEENGKTFYEAELKVNGHNKDLLIDPTGAIVEIEEQVTLESLPPAVKTALDKHAAKGKIAFVESVTKGGSVIAYEAKIKTAGKTSEIRLSPEGAAVKEP
ncbi:MAG: hypothetical protein DMG57_28280 [Acidobacteria bacterium]|nr:MAG: hypothetical protein DMG57_28280 [Acidobacteriota bacterium]